MATKIWRGDAQAVPQESRATPANVEVGDIFTLTCNQKEIAFTATAATVANVTAGLTAAWNASAEPEHAELTVTDATTYVKILGPSDGRPFTVTSSATNGGAANTQTLTMSTVSGTGTGPNYWDNADNWSPNGVPVNSDDVILENSRVSILYGLAQSAVTLATLRQYQSFEGSVGLPVFNDLGYFEYRATELAIGATLMELGLGDGNGSGRIKVNNGSVQTTMNLRGSGSGLETGVPAVLWRGTHANNAINATKGQLGIAILQGQSATCENLRIAYQTNVLGDVDVRCGVGVTLTNVEQSGGYLLTNSNITVHNLYDGELVHQNGTMGTLQIERGACRYRSAGTLTTCRVGSDAELDLRQDPRAVTITNLELHAGSTLRDPAGRATYTNGIDLYRCSPMDVTLDLPPHRTLSLSAV